MPLAGHERLGSHAAAQVHVGMPSVYVCGVQVGQHLRQILGACRPGVVVLVHAGVLSGKEALAKDEDRRVLRDGRDKR